jgi:hypothetical protein
MPSFTWVDNTKLKLPVDAEQKDIKWLFTNGHCHSLALALNKLTNWPLYGFFAKGIMHHVTVLNPDGRYVDIEGVGALDRWRSYYGDSLYVRQINRRDIRAIVHERNSGGNGYFPANTRAAIPFARRLLDNMKGAQ